MKTTVYRGNVRDSTEIYAVHNFSAEYAKRLYEKEKLERESRDDQLQTELTEHKETDATGSVSGHVKLSDSISDGSGTDDSVAATPRAVKTVNDASVRHRETGATSAVSGHVTLSDSVSEESGAYSSVAATPKAVKAVNDKLIDERAERMGGETVLERRKLTCIDFGEYNVRTGKSERYNTAYVGELIMFSVSEDCDSVLLTTDKAVIATVIEGENGIRVGYPFKAGHLYTARVTKECSVSISYPGISVKATFTPGEAYVIYDNYDPVGLKADIAKETELREDAVNDLSASITSEAETRQNAVKAVNDALENHRSGDNATGAVSGHVTLSDSVSDDSGANRSRAATPKAVKAVNSALIVHGEKQADDTAPGHVRLSDSASAEYGKRSGIAVTPKALYEVESRFDGILSGFDCGNVLISGKEDWYVPENVCSDIEKLQAGRRVRFTIDGASADAESRVIHLYVAPGSHYLHVHHPIGFSRGGTYTAVITEGLEDEPHLVDAEAFVIEDSTVSYYTEGLLDEMSRCYGKGGSVGKTELDGIIAELKGDMESLRGQIAGTVAEIDLGVWDDDSGLDGGEYDNISPPDFSLFDEDNVDGGNYSNVDNDEVWDGGEF